MGPQYLLGQSSANPIPDTLNIINRFEDITIILVS